MTNYDVMIIGGGPAGAMTGIHLQKEGLKTCIIDKAKFPRTKLCGGLITPKTYDLLADYCPQIRPDQYIVEQTNEVDFYLDKEKLTTLKTKLSYYFTERRTFDNLLIEEYQRNGGTLIENERIKADQINFDHNSITTATETYQYNYLVGADGCNSLLCKKAEIQRYDSFCIESRLPRDRTKAKEFKIYFGLAQNGYGWYFPKSDYYTIGIGGTNADKKLRERADAFFGELGLNENQPKKGALIPSGKLFSFSKLPDNTLLVGDAAGLIDPITGEGLYLALRSGLCAAKAIINAKASATQTAQNRYLLLTRSLRKDIRAAFHLNRILYSPRILASFMNHLKKHHSFALFYLEKVIATHELSYRNFITHYFFKYKRALKKQQKQRA